MRIRIYPSAGREGALRRLPERCRLLYNFALAAMCGSCVEGTASSLRLCGQTLMNRLKAGHLIVGAVKLDVMQYILATAKAGGGGTGG